MSRTIKKVKFLGNEKELDERLRNVLIAEDYKEIDYNREVVWKKGLGLVTAMQYIKLEYKDGEVIISGWIQMGVGSAGGKEQELSGVFAKIPKKSVLKTIEKIESEIRK